jgi:hypothetical protein
MSSRLSVVLSGLAIVVIITFMTVVFLGHRHSAPGRSHTALPSRPPAAAPADRSSATSPAGNASPATPADHAPALSLACIAERIRHAPAPFHWSYKRGVSGAGFADWEADISSDSIAGTLVDSSGTYPIQAVRSDGAAWKTAVSALTAPLPEGAFALLQDLPAPVPAAVEKVGGKYTVKYRIDTSRGAPADPSSIRKGLGPNGFVNGTVWVDRDGCPVKFALDVEQQLNDGSVKKGHYEGDATER